MTKLIVWFFLPFVVARAQIGPVLHPHGLDDEVFKAATKSSAMPSSSATPFASRRM